MLATWHYRRQVYNDDRDAEDNLYSNNSNRTDEKGMQISEEEEKTASVVDDEDSVEIFEENATDEEDEEDEETVNADDSDTDHEDEECILSRKGIEYSTRPTPARRRMRNIPTHSSKVIANPQSEIKSFELFLSEDILRTVLMHTNRKAREIRRTLSRLQPIKTFSMDVLKAGFAIILRAGSDRDNFTELDNLWQPKDSKPFYRAFMSLVRFKFLLRCLQFDNWNTREEKKSTINLLHAEIWDIFLINLRRSCIPEDCRTVDEQLVRYRGKIPGRTYILSKPRKYGLKMFWASEFSSGYVLNGFPYDDKEGDQVHLNLAQDIAMQLLEPYFETGRDVCTDNFFTSYNLAKVLLQEYLTFLGTTRKHRREVPGSLNRKNENLFYQVFIQPCE